MLNEEIQQKEDRFTPIPFKVVIGDGWIGYDRYIIDSFLFSDTELLKLYLYLAAAAAHRGRWITPSIKIMPGQCVFTRSMASEVLKCGASTVYHRLGRLISSGLIEAEGRNTLTIVTLRNAVIMDQAIEGIC